ncbi:MAG: acetoacetate decarboxylase family protein [Lachnospiraceae bacterium]|nr:acetoacetate decarboxylase family protein [Lachnospiraceae bacterium]
MKPSYSFVRTPEQIAELSKPFQVDIFGQELLNLCWEIDESVYKHLLPPHYEPVAPVAVAFIGRFGRPRYHHPYNEAAVHIPCQVNGVFGTLCLSMPLCGSDVGEFAGREFYSFPKRDAKVEFQRIGSRVHGEVTRNGITFFKVSATLTGSLNDQSAIEYLGPAIREGVDAPVNGDGQCFLLKYDLDADATENPNKSFCDLFQRVRIQRELSKQTFHSREYGQIDELQFEASEDDPWIELKPVRYLGAAFSKLETHMSLTKTVYEYAAEEYKDVLPHCYHAWDSDFYGVYHFS